MSNTIERQLAEDVMKLIDKCQEKKLGKILRLAMLGRAALNGYEEAKSTCACKGLYLTDKCYETAHERICVLRHFCKVLSEDSTTPDVNALMRLEKVEYALKQIKRVIQDPLNVCKDISIARIVNHLDDELSQCK